MTAHSYLLLIYLDFILKSCVILRQAPRCLRHLVKLAISGKALRLPLVTRSNQQLIDILSSSWKPRALRQIVQGKTDLII